jgi:hypothetical protein
MSREKFVTIWCDQDGCNEFYPTGQMATKDALCAARHKGWGQWGTEDYCPRHAKVKAEDYRRRMTPREAQG